MRVLVTGANGMLGKEVVRTLARQHAVTAAGVSEMDVRDIEVVRSVCRRVKPDVVVHLAALTNVDACEADPDAAFRTNAIGTQNVALGAAETDAAILYVSTISVFDGKKNEPYTEFDQPSPSNTYAAAKYAGEQMVRRLTSRHYIVRAGWLFGGRRDDKKFVAKILEQAASRSSLQVVSDKFGSPTYTSDLARGLLRLIESGVFGVYHMVNEGPCCSRLELAERVLEFAGVRTCRLVSVRSDAFPLLAPRPRMEGARNQQLALRGWDWMRPWPEALCEYIQQELGLVAGRPQILLP